MIISMKIYGGGKTVLLGTCGGQRLALTVTSTPGHLRMRSQSCNVQVSTSEGVNAIVLEHFEFEE